MEPENSNWDSAAETLHRAVSWYGQSIGNGLKPKFSLLTLPFSCKKQHEISKDLLQ
jgi:hypothetical protein